LTALDIKVPVLLVGGFVPVVVAERVDAGAAGAESVDGIVGKPDHPHAVGIAGIGIFAILVPADPDRAFAAGIPVHIVVRESLVPIVGGEDLHLFAGVHPADQVAEVFEVRAFDRPHVLLEDIGIFGGVPPDLLLVRLVG